MSAEAAPERTVVKLVVSWIEHVEVVYPMSSKVAQTAIETPGPASFSASTD